MVKAKTGKSLMIVESPSKIPALKKILGDKFIIESSIGHIRDLPEKEFGIDLEHDFEPKYVVLPDKAQVIAKIQAAAKKCDTVYLSPDPDREGEAIAWHITHILPSDTDFKRVSFNSITKDVVLKAIEHPREIDQGLVNAQQARRLLDRIVGYKISPILNRRMQRGRSGSVSAGRVQSVALKLVVDREKEILAFKPVEYWNIATIMKAFDQERTFRSTLYSVDDKRVEKEMVEGKDFYLISNQQSAESVVERLNSAKKFEITRAEKKEKKRNPVPPFITSTLQQEASRHFGFSSAKTMSIAQSLYEGVDLGREGAEGLITYMRTDSVRVVPEAINEARELIRSQFGEEYLPAQPRVYATQKAAQDAHEAVRPTYLTNSPESIKKSLSRDQFSLYNLIWKRFIASQMMPAVYDTMSVDITTENGIVLRATGSIIKFQGFLAIYEERTDEDEKSDEAKLLPPLEEGQNLSLLDVTSEQAFTRPPPRFSEASLVKELEKSGIGRPSTYVSIMNKIQSREYTVKESSRLKPTELGMVVAELLENNFQLIMNIGFTAKMEDNLELVAENHKDWKELIKEFWGQFYPTLQLAEKDASVPKVMTDLDCPLCKAKLQKVWFRSKYFYGCSNYPDCSYSAPIEEFTFNKEEYADDFDWEQKCPDCSAEMKLRHGRFGAFLGCSTYPKCKGIINIPKKGEVVIPATDMPLCPAKDCTGHMVARKSRFGKTFYSCSTFPECDVIVNDLAGLLEKYPDHPRTPYEKKGKQRGKKSAVKESAETKSKSTKAAPKTRKPSTRVSKAFALSPELADVVGATELSRGDVMKKVWDYIKTNNLQDPKNKRMIMPDAKLTKLFGNDKPVEMFALAGVLSHHIHKS